MELCVFMNRYFRRKGGLSKDKILVDFAEIDNLFFLIIRERILKSQT